MRGVHFSGVEKNAITDSQIRGPKSSAILTSIPTGVGTWHNCMTKLWHVTTPVGRILIVVKDLVPLIHIFGHRQYFNCSMTSASNLK